ncbi:MAG: hypothetical protein M1825_003580 [Sarcosagium campestre]|nr:MAG: hypothetical protein M1825_003580 [Sarcosagium campestre]
MDESQSRRVTKFPGMTITSSLSLLELFCERVELESLTLDRGSQAGQKQSLRLYLQSFIRVGDLLQLRQTSHTLRTWVDAAPSRAFRTLYFLPSFFTEKYRWDMQMRGLRAIGARCEKLQVEIGHGGPAEGRGDSQPTPSVQASTTARQSSESTGRGQTTRPRRRLWSLLRRRRPGQDQPGDSSSIYGTAASARPADEEENRTTMPKLWRELIGHLPNLSQVTLTMPGVGRPSSASSPTFTTLLSLRLALEIRPNHHRPLRRFDAYPIPLLYLAALRFSGGGSYASADWMSGPVWAGLRTLKLHLTAPHRAEDGRADDARLGGKMLHDYLFSFSDTLEELEVRWVRDNGINMLFLDEAAGWNEGRMFSAPPVEWRCLKRVSLSGMAVSVEQIRRLFIERAKALVWLRAERGLLATDRSAMEEWARNLEGRGLCYRVSVDGEGDVVAHVWRRHGWSGEGSLRVVAE